MLLKVYNTRVIKGELSAAGAVHFYFFVNKVPVDHHFLLVNIELDHHCLVFYSLEACWCHVWPAWARMACPVWPPFAVLPGIPELASIGSLATGATSRVTRAGTSQALS